ncbi:putative heavy metal-associated domain, HMA, heavy metal-associated domain superfamily [Helianthus annuus]|uniref:Heavy metal-associated domain, HMA, heavy metal-associated domain superfamily n=1 Tax=Helianthus annuus TaxID=4232 RepID=A0A251RWS4_HELAN|nr:heavy metal-associated isoprenylated plant protein 7 [Helianthus annuus]KAF5757940.1 putative heavy metal-associated domain, HMA, heavy metal-associated domain superfamily [Helianthus annuus]
MGEQVEKPVEEKKPAEEEKKEEEAAKPDEKKAEESKDATPPPPPPPQEIVLRVFMHCEGCARKVRRCLRGFDGVEDIQTDCKTHKVVVKGEKADPMKVLERIQKKSHRQVELLSPIPKPPAEEPKVEEKEPPKSEEKKEEPPQVITVVLKVNMHCEACAQVIRKRILRMKEVESVEADLKNSQVTVKGTFEATKLVDYIFKRTGKQAVVVKQDPEPKKEDEKGKEEKKDGGEEKKDGGDEKKDGEDAAASNGDGGDGKEKDKEKEKEEKKPDGGNDGGNDGGGDGGKAAADDGAGGGGEDLKVVELHKNEFYYYHPANYQFYPARYGTAEVAYGYPPAPQMFSDENPNACSVM